MKECEGHMKQEEIDQIIKEVYGEISSHHCKTDSESSSLGFVDTSIEMTGSLIGKEVLSYDHNVIDESYISKLHSNNHIFSTGNEEDAVLEPYVVGERVCITRPKGVSDGYFYFYSGKIEDFKICIPFIAFEYDLIQTQNIDPSQLRQNGWVLLKLLR